MERTDGLARLPAAHATALRLHEAGQPDEVIATALGIEVEGVAPLLAVAAAKLDHIDHRTSDDLGLLEPATGCALAPPVPTGTGDDVVDQLAVTPPFDRLHRASLVRLAAELRTITLQAGDTLLRQHDSSDELYVILEGALRATLRDEAGIDHDLGTLSVGAVVGEMVVMSGGSRASTLVAETAVRLVGLSAVAFGRLIEANPSLGTAMAEETARRLHHAQLVGHLTSLFPDMDPTGLAEVGLAVDWVTLEAGDVLFGEGDVGDAAYLVVSGRLRVVIAGPDGVDDVVADIGRGELVGEMALIKDAPRNATVYAARDTDLARLPRAAFLDLIDRYPRAMLFVARTVIDRVRAPAQAARRVASAEVSIALVAAHDTIDLGRLAEGLASELGRLGRLRHLSSASVDRDLGRSGLSQSHSGEPGGVRLAQWLHAIEADHDLLLYEADRDWTPWTRRCLRQADHVVVVADATADPRRTDVEDRIREVLGGRREPRESLLLVHPARTAHPTGTPLWLESRDVENVYHLRWERDSDLARLGRLLAGRAVGLTLSGGGARGFAHIGVVRALHDAGIPVDAIAGSSVGMALGTIIAMDHEDDAALATMATEAFASVRDHTFPAIAVLKGARIVESARRIHGDRDLSDLWLPFLGISTNLTTSRVATHRRGDICAALRASVAIPGVLPPIVYGEEIHVDGGVLNNLPVDELRRRLPTSTIVAVDVAPRRGPRARGHVGLSVSGWGVARDRLRRRRPPLPGLATTMMLAMLAGANQARDRTVDAGLADLYLRLDLPRCGLLEFDAAETIMAAGYEAAVEPIAQWLREGAVIP